MILQVHLNPAFLETWVGCKVANSCGNFSVDSGKFFWPSMVLTKTIKVASLDSSMQIATNCTHGKNQLMMRMRDLCRKQPYFWVSLFISDGHWIPVIRVVLNNPVYLLMVPHGSDAPRAIKQLSDEKMGIPVALLRTVGETLPKNLSWTAVQPLELTLHTSWPSPKTFAKFSKGSDPKNTKNMLSQGFFHSIILISFVSILEKLWTYRNHPTESS